MKSVIDLCVIFSDDEKHSNTYSTEVKETFSLFTVSTHILDVNLTF